MNATAIDTSDPMATSEAWPPKPEGRALIVRVARMSGDQVLITERDGKHEKLVMRVPFARVAARMCGESVAFFTAEIDGVSGVLELIQHAPFEKGWVVFEHTHARTPPRSSSAKMLGPAPERCPCGAPRHREMCRDAIACMNGRRSARWRAPGM